MSRIWLALSVATGLAGLLTGAVRAQPVVVESSMGPRTIVRHYGPEYQIPNEATSVVQTRDGALWMGTYSGLFRFDGAKFTAFPADTRYSFEQAPAGQRSGRIRSDRITALYEDGRGQLWIGTQDGGLSYYANGRFTQTPFCQGRCYILHVVRADADHLWIVSSAGMARYHVDQKRVVAPRLPADSNRYGDIGVGFDGSVYLADREKIYRLADGVLRPLDMPPGLTHIFGLISVGSELVVGGNDGTWTFEQKTRRWSFERTPLMAPLDSTDGAAWWVSSDGTVWMRPPGKEPQRVQEIPPMAVNRITHDREGALWIASVDRGLWSVRRSEETLLKHASGGLVFPGKAAAPDKEGGTWLAVGCHGLWYLPAGATSTVAPARQDPLKNLCITSLWLDAEQALWIGSIDSVYRLKHDELTKVDVPTGMFNLQVFDDPEGGYWLTGDFHTAHVSVTQAGIHVSPPVALLEGLTIRHILPARGGGTWFVGNGGIRRVVKGAIVEQYGADEGISSRFARYLQEDKDGTLWVATYGGGLNRIRQGKITVFDTSHGLLDNSISCIKRDTSGRMWLGGNQGISLFREMSDGSAENLPVAMTEGGDAMEMNGGVASSCVVDGQGRLWFALVNGYAVIDPRNVRRDAIATPQVQVDEAISGGRKVSGNDGIELRVGDRELEISFSAVNLNRPDELEFRYRMDGSGTDWTYARAARSVIYQNVPGGKSQFEVQARNRGGAWSPSATLRVDRPTPWYEFNWIWPLITLVGLSLLFRRSQDRRVKQQQRIERLKREGIG